MTDVRKDPLVQRNVMHLQFHLPGSEFIWTENDRYERDTTPGHRFHMEPLRRTFELPVFIDR